MYIFIIIICIYIYVYIYILIINKYIYIYIHYTLIYIVYIAIYLSCPIVFYPILSIIESIEGGHDMSPIHSAQVTDWTDAACHGFLANFKITKVGMFHKIQYIYI